MHQDTQQCAVKGLEEEDCLLANPDIFFKNDVAHVWKETHSTHLLNCCYFINISLYVLPQATLELKVRKQRDVVISKFIQFWEIKAGTY